MKKVRIVFVLSLVIAAALMPMMRAQEDEHEKEQELAALRERLRPKLILPTNNDTLYSDGGARFYQHIERDYKGVKSTPWEGGQYGFVREPVESAAGLIYTRFHEGIDIRPVERSATGEPQDQVRSIADGMVVYVNPVPGFSNYGKYVVVEHRLDGADYYSLYGHLAAVTVQPGRKVRQSEQLGVMGYTGAGLNRERAHLHLELNLLLSRHFESWYAQFAKNDPNHHGIYNGLNLAGIDIARFYIELRKHPKLTVPEFLADEETFYRVKLPASPGFDLAQRYPWLLHKSAADSSPAAWEISFNRAGVPLRVTAEKEAVTAPVLSYVERHPENYANLTRGVVGGSGASPHLTETGERLMRLLTWSD